MLNNAAAGGIIKHRATERSIHLEMRLPPMDWMNHLQWPAMAVTLLSAFLVAAQSKSQRQWGFWFFLLSNLLWVAWGWHARAYALIILQFGLAALNMRGVAKNKRA